MKVIHSQIEKIWKTPKNKKEATTLPFKKTTLRFSYISVNTLLFYLFKFNYFIYFFNF